jgi:biotin transport system substrate-specific component
MQTAVSKFAGCYSVLRLTNSSHLVAGLPKWRRFVTIFRQLGYRLVNPDHWLWWMVNNEQLKEKFYQMRQTFIRGLVLSQIFWPERSLMQTVTLMLAGSWLIALAAQIQIPLWPVPVTGQTFAVLLIAAWLGSRRGAGSVGLYLAQGAMGLPFFASGAAGIAVLAGPTAGYLFGFVLAAYVVGWLAERGWDRQVGTAVMAMILGNIAIYACGLFWLSQFLPLSQLLSAGLFPFVPGDTLKIVLAALVLPGGWRLSQTE